MKSEENQLSIVSGGRISSVGVGIRHTTTRRTTSVECRARPCPCRRPVLLVYLSGCGTFVASNNNKFLKATTWAQKLRELRDFLFVVVVAAATSCCCLCQSMLLLFSFFSEKWAQKFKAMKHKKNSTLQKKAMWKLATARMKQYTRLFCARRLFSLALLWPWFNLCCRVKRYAEYAWVHHFRSVAEAGNKENS